MYGTSKCDQVRIFAYVVRRVLSNGNLACLTTAEILRENGVKLSHQHMRMFGSLARLFNFFHCRITRKIFLTSKLYGKSDRYDLHEVKKRQEE
jgi:hypothetical protein